MLGKQGWRSWMPDSTPHWPHSQHLIHFMQLKLDLKKTVMDAACGAGENQSGRKEQRSLGNNTHPNVTHSTLSVAKASSDSCWPFMENLVHFPVVAKMSICLGQAHIHMCTHPHSNHSVISHQVSLLSASGLGWKSIQEQEPFFFSFPQTWKNFVSIEYVPAYIHT